MFKHILGAAAVAALLSVGCSSSSDSTTPATADAGKTDSGVARPDAGTTPSADSGAPAATCEAPSTTPTFETPATLPPAAAWGQNKCQDATVQGFLDACLTGANASKAACDTWKAANANCAACLLTPKNAAAVGPFLTDPAVTADDQNPPGLVNDGFLSSITACLNHFKAGCGEKYFAFSNCLGAACDTDGNCKNASDADLDTCQEDAIGGGQGVCGQVAIAALGQNGACRGVFPQDAGTAPTGELCFSKGAAGGEDTSTDAGLVAFFKRFALQFCGQ